MAKSVPMMQNYFSSGIFSSVDSEDMHINNNYLFAGNDLYMHTSLFSDPVDIQLLYCIIVVKRKLKYCLPLITNLDDICPDGFTNIFQKFHIVLKGSQVEISKI